MGERWHDYFKWQKKMKTAFITGANKGIGFETARQLARLGYRVFIGSRDRSKGLEATEQLRAQGADHVDWVEMDVTHVDSIRSAVREMEGKVQQLDVLINNAGIAGRQPQRISTGDIGNLRDVFETNFFGAVQTTQQFLPLLNKSAEPRIVNVSSRLGSLSLRGSLAGNPAGDLYDAYSASKTALNALTLLLAYEFRDTSFKINSVDPGYTATDLNDFKGVQTVEQAAGWVVKYATLDKDGPTGRFFSREREIGW